MCKYLTDILNPLDERAHSFLKNSKQLKEELETLEIDESHMIGSFDIKHMFPMIPVQKTLQITRDQLDKDDTLETHFQSYKGDIYTQTDGTPIEKSISGPLARIFVTWFEQLFVIQGKFKAQIVFWRRMKDDKGESRNVPTSFLTYSSVNR